MKLYCMFNFLFYWLENIYLNFGLIEIGLLSMKEHLDSPVNSLGSHRKKHAKNLNSNWQTINCSDIEGLNYRASRTKLLKTKDKKTLYDPLSKIGYLRDFISFYQNTQEPSLSCRGSGSGYHDALSPILCPRFLHLFLGPDTK